MKSIHDLEDSFSGKSWLSINRPYLIPEMYVFTYGLPIYLNKEFTRHLNVEWFGGSCNFPSQ